MILGLALATVIGMVFFAPVVDAVNSNTGTQSVTNETVAAQHGEYVDLSGYDIDSGETVYGFNDSSGEYETMSGGGTNYTMNYSAGSIQVTNGDGTIQDGEDIKVSYDYQAAGELASLVIGFIPVGFAVLLFAKLAFGAQRGL